MYPEDAYLAFGSCLTAGICDGVFFTGVEVFAVFFVVAVLDAAEPPTLVALPAPASLLCEYALSDSKPKHIESSIVLIGIISF